MGQLQGRCSLSFQEPKQEESSGGCHCSTTSTASGSSRWNTLSRINTGQRDDSGEGTYGRTLANPAVWLGQKQLTETDRRSGQDWHSSLSQGPGNTIFPTCGASGMRSHVPINPVHTAAQVQCRARKMGSEASRQPVVHLSPDSLYRLL